MASKFESIISISTGVMVGQKIVTLIMPEALILGMMRAIGPKNIPIFQKGY